MTGQEQRTRRRTIYAVLLVALLGHVSIAWIAVARVKAFQVSQLSAVDERQSVTLTALEERLRQLEADKSDARLRVLESDMAEVKWLARGMVLTVAGQFILVLMRKEKAAA